MVLVFRTPTIATKLFSSSQLNGTILGLRGNNGGVFTRKKKKIEYQERTGTTVIVKRPVKKLKVENLL